MHFWIDKRSQACGFGRSRVAASLSNASNCGGSYGHQPPRRHLTSKNTQLPPPSVHRHQNSSQSDHRYHHNNNSRSGMSSSSNNSNNQHNSDNNCNNNLSGSNSNRHSSNSHRNNRYCNQQQQQQSRYLQQRTQYEQQQQQQQQQPNQQLAYATAATTSEMPQHAYVDGNEQFYSVGGYINSNGNYCNNRSYTTTTTTTLTDENSIMNNHYSSPNLNSSPIMSSNPTNIESNNIINNLNTRNNLNNLNNNNNINNNISNNNTSNNNNSTGIPVTNNNQRYHHVNITLPHIYGGSPNAQNLEQGSLGLMGPLSNSTMHSSNSALAVRQQHHQQQQQVTPSSNSHHHHHHHLIENSESQLLPSHLKCGMWASLVLASVFVAGAKFYFDHQGTGLEVLIFCAFSATFFLAACTVSLCRFPRELAHTPATSLDRGLDNNSINGSSSATTVINGMIGNSMLNMQQNRQYGQLTYDQIQHQQLQEHNQLLAVASAAAPPPYHIAIMLPESTTKDCVELDETPPPSYDKILI